MRIEQYLTYIDYALWEVIVNGDTHQVASASAGTKGLIPPKTAEQKLARKNELKAKNTLLLAIPDEHLLKSEGLDKTYDRFQKLISQLEIHGEVISQEDANLKLLRSLPSAWNNIALIMRNKSDLDTLSMDDLYNNLKVYEAEIKGQSSSSSNSQNVAFVSSENTSSTNEAVNTAHEVSTTSSQGQASSLTYADDVMFSFFANQSNSPQLDNEDLEQIDTDDLEEMDLKWQVAMLTMRVKRFLKKTRRNLNFNGKETIGFDKTNKGSTRFIISLDSSHRSSTNATEVKVDSFIRSAAPLSMMTEAVITTSIASVPSILVPEAAAKFTSQVQHSIFHDSSSTSTIKPDVAGPSYLPRKELSMGSREINSETFLEVFVPQWNVPNDNLLDDHDISWEFIDHLAPPILFAQIRKMDYHYLFTEFSIGTARQACLNAEIKMRTEYCLSERRRLESKCERQADLLKVSVVEAAKKVHADELDALKQKSVALEDERDSLNGKIMELQSSVSAKDLELKDFNVTVHALETTCSSLRDQVAKLDANFVEMALYLEEKFILVFLPLYLAGEYIAALRAAISRAIEKGMQSGLSTEIDYGKEGRILADVVTYNLVAEADYNSAPQRLREVDFPLLTELSSHKDASVEYIMNLLFLESPLADAPRMSDLQPDVPLVEPLSAENLMGASGTSDSVPATIATTTALSTTFASTTSVPPITIDDYEIVGAYGQEDT
ncbi:hypothetical protein Tco_0994061 [Tanacetum coccineum]